MADKIKLIVAILILAGAVVGFYQYAEHSLLLRVVGILVAVGMSSAVALQTEVGQVAWGFIGDSRTEARKVVWPSRKETTQTTLIVVIMVFLIGIVLWLLDMLLLWGVQTITS